MGLLRCYYTYPLYLGVTIEGRFTEESREGLLTVSGDRTGHIPHQERKPVTDFTNFPP